MSTVGGGVVGRRLYRDEILFLALLLWLVWPGGGESEGCGRVADDRVSCLGYRMPACPKFNLAAPIP